MTPNKNIEILLVEDNPHEARLTILSLEEKNLADNLMHVDDGAEALDYLFGQGEFADRNMMKMPKLVLLDLKMPKINGLEVLEKIKSSDLTKQIPVVILTSSKEDLDIKKCYELGANSYIVKPVGFENFLTAVSELCVYWLMLNQRPY